VARTSACRQCRHAICHVKATPTVTLRQEIFPETKPPRMVRSACALLRGMSSAEQKPDPPMSTRTRSQLAALAVALAIAAPAAAQSASVATGSKAAAAPGEQAVALAEI